MAAGKSNNILAEIDQLEEQVKQRLNYARRLVENRSRACFIEDWLGHCNFGGYLLVTVVDRKSEAAVYIQDADDWGMELIVRSVQKAERLFDALFHGRSGPGVAASASFTKEFKTRLEQMGFT